MPGKHSGFKMYGKSPMMKKLIGKQHNLPEELKAKILASDSPMEMYGKKSPAKNYKNPQDYKVFNMGNKPTPVKKKDEKAKKPTFNQLNTKLTATELKKLKINPKKGTTYYKNNKTGKLSTIS